MYFITTVCRDENESNPFQGHRCFGYCSSRQCAIDWVNENMGDIQECYYNWAVIENIGEGIHAMPEEEIWFKWDSGTKHWIHAEKPGWAHNIINWAIG